MSIQYEFYRNPEQWKFLTEKVFPELVKDFGQTLKIWSAACSTADSLSLTQKVAPSQCLLHWGKRHIPLSITESYIIQGRSGISWRAWATIFRATPIRRCCSTVLHSGGKLYWIGSMGFLLLQHPVQAVLY